MPPLFGRSCVVLLQNTQLWGGSMAPAGGGGTATGGVGMTPGGGPPGSTPQLPMSPAERCPTGVSMRGTWPPPLRCGDAWGRGGERLLQTVHGEAGTAVRGEAGAAAGEGAGRGRLRSAKQRGSASEV